MFVIQINAILGMIWFLGIGSLHGSCAVVLMLFARGPKCLDLPDGSGSSAGPAPSAA